MSVSSQSMISKSGTLREDVVLSSPAFIWLEKSVVNFYRAMLCIARTMLSQDVRPSVETAKRIRKLFSPSGNYTILVFSEPNDYSSSPAGTPNGDVKCRAV